MLALGLGLLLGLVSLVPGLYLAPVLLVLLHWLGGSAWLTVSVAIGMGVGLSCLPNVWSPVGRVETADVGIQLAYAGRGRSAVQLLRPASWAGGSLALVIGMLAWGFWPLAGLGAKHLVGWILAAIVLWMLSLGPAATVVTLGAGLLGGVCFSHLSGDWAVVALLGGLIGLPGGLNTVLGGRVQWPEEKGGQYGLSMAEVALGTVLGLLGGFLAGVGGGSLLAVVRRGEDPEVLLQREGAAEAAGLMMAIVVFWALGSVRSGLLAGLTPDVGLGVWPLVWAGVGLWIGVGLSVTLEDHYPAWIARLPFEALTGLMLAGLVGGVWLHLGWGGLVVMACGLVLSGWGRRRAVPNQCYLACLALPVLVNLL